MGQPVYLFIDFSDFPKT